MRIAIVTAEFPTLSETFVINHVMALLELGHDVTVFAFRHDVTAHLQEKERAHGLEQIVRPLDPFVSDSAVLRLLRRLKLLMSTGCKRPDMTMRALDLRIGGRGALNLSLYTYAHAFAQQRAFDIVHCHFGWSGILGAKVKKVSAFQSKLITTFHGADVNVAAAAGTARQRSLLFETGDWFTANTNFTREQAISLGCPPERCSIWHMGVDTKLFDFCGQSVTDGEPIRVVTVGRLVEKKGIEYVIRALPLLRRRDRRTEYHVVGDGPMRSYLRQLALELGVGEQVIFHGHCTADAVRRHLYSSHIFVLASVTAANNDREGQGVALIEAQACGLPVIATNHNGFPEAVLDGQSAFLVPERDPQALAERLSYLIANPDVWGQMGRAGRRFVEQEFALDRCTRVITTLYEQLLRDG